jgi:hypothetical protein
MMVALSAVRLVSWLVIVSEMMVALSAVTLVWLVMAVMRLVSWLVMVGEMMAVMAVAVVSASSGVGDVRDGCCCVDGSHGGRDQDDSVDGGDQQW